jgi:luciferase family oxidoreductase group 1
MLLSVFDILPPADLPRLIVQLDSLGYHRFWATEHHSPTQSASPTLVACLAAAMTPRIRVGTAGILLNYACPAKVAEDFRLLELYFPGRIDLGVAGAIIAHEEMYLDGRPRSNRESYAARLRTLVSLVLGDHDVVVGPIGLTRPTLWLCGSSVFSAILAGELGMYYVCHRPKVGSSEKVRTIIAAYREAYRGTGCPYSAVAAFGTCAEAEITARRLWPHAISGLPCFVGTPQASAEQIQSLVADCGADEAVIQLLIHDVEARINGYQLLADAVGLECTSSEVDF